jgi:hypothetical protein
VIDFRYHLVSLVSVFLALAVGIVLGAGPLEESIGVSLTDQVDSLRQDRDELRAQVGDLESVLADREAYAEAVAPALVDRQLGGRSVAVVVLPGADADVVDAAVDLLTASGAEVTGRVEILPRWTDPEEATFRETLAEQLLRYVDPPPEAGAGTDVRLGAVLARALVTDDLAAADAADPDAETVLEALRGGELVAVEGDAGTRATLALVIAGGPQQATTGDGEPLDTGPAYRELAAALDAASAGAVVVAPTSSAQDPTGVISAVRSGDAADRVSTVDVVSAPLGRVAAVWGLREQLNGGVGHYGTGEGASALLPPVAAAPSGDAPSDGETPSGDGTDGGEAQDPAQDAAAPSPATP